MKKSATTGFHRAALLQKAGTLFRSNNFLQAQNICEELIAENRNDINALELLAMIAYSQGKYEESIKLVKKCVALQPKHPHFHNILGGRYMGLGRYDEAIESFRRVLKFAPGNHEAITGIAETHEKKGDRDEARAVLAPFVQTGSETVYMARIQALIDTADGNAARAVEVLERHGKRGPMPVRCIFTLAKAYEKLGDADRAYEVYTIANQAAAIPFNLEAYTKEIDAMMELFTRDSLKRMPRARTDSNVAVFVTGRPRSGTTLVATIISSHPEAFDGGEMGTVFEIIKSISFDVGSSLMYPQVVRDLDQNDVDQVSQRYLQEIREIGGNAKRVVDKNLSTYMHLGLIQLLLPNARVIRCRRNPIDNCLACFTEYLNDNFPYTADLHLLGATYVQYERLMAHWAAVLDIPILDIDYEELVANQEEVTRRMIEFVGLPWDDQCLRFHEQKDEKRTTKTNLTLSYDQVRRPIYKSSVGRAKKFEKHLGPLIDALVEGGVIERPVKDQSAEQSPAA